MPLASDLAASQRRAAMVEQEKKEQQRRERRLSSAFPSSCAPAAAVHGAKARRRRSSASRQNSQSSFMEADDVKENDVPAKEQPPGGQPFQHHPPIDPRHTRKPSGSSFEEAAPPVPPSPSYRATPYWMVAAERGMSPPETRSASKKSRRADGDNGVGGGGKPVGCGVMLFSPPDQVSNARREEKERQEKEYDRGRRVERARKNGQLLIFSPSKRALNLLPGDNDDESVEEEGLQHIGDTLPNEDDCGQDGTSEGHPASNPNEEMTIMLKQLLEKVQQNDGRHVTKELLTELQNASNAKLEQHNEHLQAELKQATEQWRSETACFLIKTTRLEGELESARLQMQALPKLEQQVSELQREKSQQLLQIQSLQEKLASNSEALHRYTAQMESLREHNQAELRQISESNKILKRTESELSSNLEKAVQARQKLSAKVDEYEQLIAKQEAMLNASQVQLAGIKKVLQSKEETIASIRQQSTGHESTIVNLKDEIEKLQLTCKTLRESSTSQRAKSEHRLEEIGSQVEAKNAMIGDLFRQLGEKENELTTLSSEWDRAKTEFAQVEEKQAAQVAELDQALEQTMTQMDEYEAVKQGLLTKLQEAEKSMEDQRRVVEDHAAQGEAVKCELQSTLRTLRQAENDRDRAQRSLKERSTGESETSHLLQSVQASFKDMEERFKDREAEIRELKRRLKESELERDEARNNMLGFSDREAELYRKLQESDRLRRNLHSRVMQLAGNIRVFVRVRPLLPLESAGDVVSMTGKDKKKRGREDEETPFSFPGIYDRECKSSRSDSPDAIGTNMIVATEPYKDRGGLSDRRKTWKFNFDNVFSPHHGQDDVWEATLPLVQSAVDGYNVTIFAYGQTSSGKTYTMLGDETNPGVVGRAVEKLFQSKREIEELSRGDATVQVSVELLEIYNERINDLLDPDSPVNRNEHSLKFACKEVVGNVVVQTKSESEVMELVALAQDRRCVKATASNTESSRSHMIFTINFRATMKDGSTRNGKLNICDLAGSERLSKSGTHLIGGALLEETKNINKSLCVLSNVVERLQAGEKTIPFRESKLTMLLQNSLGGNSKTLAIVCCNPQISHFHESLCSLKFAEKVNKVELKAVNSFSC